MLKIGDRLPEVLGRDENGREIRLADYAGRKLVLYFYPNDNTSGCTAEACSLRDHHADLQTLGAEVLGVSTDSEVSHRKFIEKQNLPFHLIADTDKELVQAAGAWGEKSMCGRKYMGTFRTTFLVGEDGRVERIFTPKEVKTKEHGAQVLAALQG